MASTIEKPTVAFLGATGGCCLAVLSRCLQAGYPCRALARTPQKLTSLLSERSVPTKTLTIIAGSISSPTAVQDTLRGADIIFSGVGGTPKWWPNPFRPVLDQPTICSDTADAIVNALAALPEKGNKKPLLVVVSTTGISKSVRDVPLLMVPMYKLMLHHPHMDKEKMEKKIVEQMRLPEEKRVIDNFVIVRPSLLMDGEPVGVEKVREGVEKQVNGKWVGSPAVGYTIRRDDVGGWIFEKAAKGKDAAVEKYGGGFVSITY